MDFENFYKVLEDETEYVRATNSCIQWKGVTIAAASQSTEGMLG